MIKRSALPLGVGITFLLAGLAIWPLSYSQVSLPDSLFGFPLWTVFICALLVRALTKSGWLLVSFAIGSGPLLAYFARMIVDTSRDPTSHNLWPIALFITGVVTFPVAALGSSVVSLFRFLQKKK